MKPTFEELCLLIRKYEVDFIRASEMSEKDRAAVEWAIARTQRKEIDREGSFEGNLIDIDGE